MQNENARKTLHALLRMNEIGKPGLLKYERGVILSRLCKERPINRSQNCKTVGTVMLVIRCDTLNNKSEESTVG